MEVCVLSGGATKDLMRLWKEYHFQPVGRRQHGLEAAFTPSQGDSDFSSSFRAASSSLCAMLVFSS